MVVAVAVAVIVRVAAEASTPTFSSPRDSCILYGTQGPRRQQLHSEARAGRGGTIRRPQLPAGRTTSGVGIGNCGVLMGAHPCRCMDAMRCSHTFPTRAARSPAARDRDPEASSFNLFYSRCEDAMLAHTRESRTVASVDM